MKPLTARWVYCIGLFLLTACAVLPEAKPTPVAAESTSTALTVETRLAQAIRDRIERQQAYSASDPVVQQSAATETALRELAFADDRVQTRTDLISALANQLSDALSDRTDLTTRLAPRDPEVRKANAVVTALTAAINAEVQRNRG